MIERRTNPIEINRNFQAALSQIQQATIKRGHIRLYLENADLLPLITIEDDEDSVTHTDGAQSLNHSLKTWRIRATVSAGSDSQPDEALNQILTEMRAALFRSKSHDFSGISLKEHKPASFTLPEPGLPLACATLFVSASFNEIL